MQSPLLRLGEQCLRHHVSFDKRPDEGSRESLRPSGQETFLDVADQHRAGNRLRNAALAKRLREAGFIVVPPCRGSRRQDQCNADQKGTLHQCTSIGLRLGAVDSRVPLDSIP